MTLRDFYHECVAAKERLEAERKQAMTMAWLTAAFSRMNTLPALATVLNIRAAAEHQTPTQQQSVLATLSARYGIPLQRTRLIRRDDGRQ